MCFLIFLPNASQILVNTASSPDSRIAVLEKLACIPLPFQSVSPNGLGCQSMVSPYFSALRSARYLETQIWSPASRAPLAKIWYSHCPAATSALIPSTFKPASKHWLRWSSIISRPNAFAPPTEQ